MVTYIIPVDTGGWLGSDKNYNTLLIIMGPENCNKLATVARMPDIKNKEPKYFLKDDNIFLVLDYYQL